MTSFVLIGKGEVTTDFVCSPKYHAIETKCVKEQQVVMLVECMWKH